MNRLKEIVVNSGLENNHESINKTWALQFTDHLCYEEDFINSTVICYLKALRSVLEFYDLPIGFKMKDATATLRGGDKMDVPKPFIPFDQLKKLYASLDSNPAYKYFYHEDIMNMFAFSCQTGCRFNELMSLTEDNLVEVDGITMLRYTAGKKGRTVEVPLSEDAKQISSLYPNEEITLFSQISNEEANTVLTDILRESGMFNKTEQVVTYSGKTRKEENVPLYNLITWHSARRSFGSNLIANGLSFQDVSDLMGISVATLISYYSSSDKKTRNTKALEILNRI